MASKSPDLPLNDHYKKALTKLDFKYFLELETQNNQYTTEQVEQIHKGYQNELKELNAQKAKNKKQFYYWLEGKIRLMFEGQGFLPGFFGLDGWTRKRTTIDFFGFGESWAMFDVWQKHERKMQRRKITWTYITRFGAVLAIVLAIIRVVQAFIPKEAN